MSLEILVLTTSRFDRELKKLARRHPELPRVFRGAMEVLKADPQNRSVNTPSGNWRLSLWARDNTGLAPGGFVRYDIGDKAVVLKACSLRREDSYR